MSPTNPLTVARQDLTAALAAIEGLGMVLGDVPEGFTPPAVIVVPGDEWISAGETFGTWTGHALIQIVSGGGDNATKITDLETKNALLLAHLPHQYVLGSISAPFAITVGDAVYAASTIAVSYPLD